MRKRDVRTKAEALWGKDYYLESYQCTRMGCKHDGCDGYGDEKYRWHYNMGYYTEAQGVIPKQPVVLGQGYSWDEALKRVTA